MPKGGRHTAMDQRNYEVLSGVLEANPVLGSIALPI